MPTPDLTSYKSIQSNLFVRIEVDYYKPDEATAATSTVLRFCDKLTPTTINSEVYVGVGNLMNISSTGSELRVSGGELTITLSGIPNSSIYEIVNSRIKGCPISVYRALFNSTTGALLAIAGNPIGRYRGYINNYSLNEDFDSQNRSSSNTLVLTCNSSVDVLNNKISGRKTNPTIQKAFYPGDLCFDRVTTLENTTFNFGAPQ
jgi:hypothetical protein